MFSDSGLNCIYVISGDYATLIPDEDFHRGIEFQDPTSLVFDDLDNMIVVDRSPKLKVIDKERSYVGDIQVKFITLILDIANLFISRATSLALVQHRRSIWTNGRDICTSTIARTTSSTSTSCSPLCADCLVILVIFSYHLLPGRLSVF